MSRRMAVLAVAVLAIAGAAAMVLPAHAGPSTGKAVFCPLTSLAGTLTVSSSPGTSFVVRAQQLDGSYAAIAGGSVGLLGAATVLVPNFGPESDGKPQYSVTLSSPGSEPSVVFAVKVLEEQWWLD